MHSEPNKIIGWGANTNPIIYGIETEFYTFIFRGDGEKNEM